MPFSPLRKQWDLVVLCHDVDRGIDLNGKAASQILDPLADQLEKQGFSCLRVASLGSKMGAEQAYKNPISLKGIKRKIKFRLLIRRLLSGKILRQKYKHKILNKMVYEKMLAQSNAKAVLAISPDPELCQIGICRNIPIIEAWHGFGVPDNCWVHGAKARSKTTDTYEPKFFISFDERTHQTRREGDKGKRARSFLAKRAPIDAGAYLLHPSHRLLAGNPGKKGLITLQWGYDGEATFLNGIIPNGVMHPALMEAIQKRRDITWLFRFHPMQTRRKDKWRGIANFIKDNFSSKGLTVVDVSFLPLDYVLSRADFHITMMSGAVYEAASSGVPSIALCPTIHADGINGSFFKDLEKEGKLQKCTLDASLIGMKIDELSAPKRDNQLIASDTPEMVEVVSKILLGRDGG